VTNYAPVARDHTERSRTTEAAVDEAATGVTERWLRISEAARLAGVSPSTIRVWESGNLLQSQRDGRYRRFSTSNVERLRAIAALRSRGYSLPAIRERLEGGPDEPAPTTQVSQSNLGPLLRRTRTRQGITLQQAAQGSGLSVSHISAVERDLGNISMTALQHLAHALGIQVSDLFSSDSRPERLVHAGRGPTLLLSAGRVRMESLSVSARLLQAHVFVVEPGGESEGAYRHEGEEIAHVVEGEVEFCLDESELYRIGEGDSLTFPSAMAHRWRNTLPRRAVMIWVNTPITF
jgi:DNA-binding transcriptional MerR regulator/quercetin dioxygenase-like cupin family protein